MHANWQKLLDVRDEVLKALEQARQSRFISSSLEAKVVMEVSQDAAELLQRYQATLPALYIVSQVDVIARDGSAGNVTIHKADGSKCERCWNYSTHVGESVEYPTVCERCLPVVKEILGGGAAVS